MNAKHVVRVLILISLVSALMLLLLKPQAEGQKIVTRPTATPTPTSKPKPKPATTSKSAPVITSNGIEFVRIPAGEFVMGSTNGAGRERPVHLVRISHSFEMGKYEVTQAQWEAAMGRSQSKFKGANLPVEMVSWDDVQGFILVLNSRKDGYLYRLPTEAEWEYACRAGTTKDYAGNLDEMGWYGNNSGKQRLKMDEVSQADYSKRLEENECQTHAVGQKKQNAWGLYDMHGNVWEWVQDLWGENYYGESPAVDPQGPGSGSGRVMRGGAWVALAWSCRSANRSNYPPGNRGNHIGFRLVRTPR